MRQRTAVPIKKGIASQKKKDKKKEKITIERQTTTMCTLLQRHDISYPGLLLSSPQGIIDKALSEGQTDTQVSVSDEILEYI